MSVEEKQTKENCVFSGRIFKVYDDEVEFVGGGKSRREIVCHNGGCSVLPVLDDKYFLLVKQYRYAYRAEVLEIPAGKLELNEEPKACAIRELKEEVGCIAGKITDLGHIYPTTGYCNEKIYIYIAEQLTMGENCLDEGEFLDVIKLPIDKAYDMVINNEIKDSKTIIAILRYFAKKKHN